MDAMSTAEDSLRPDVNITAPSEKTAARARLFTPPVTAAVSGFELRFPKIGNWLEPPSSLYQPAPMVSSSPGPFPDDSSSLTALDHTSAPDADDDGAPKTTSPYGQLRLGQPKIPTPDPVTGVFGASYVDAIVHILPPYWKPPMGDTPFPAPGKESQLVVRRLRDALLNTNNTKDNKNNIYNAHWTPGMSKMFLEWQADRVCWEILNETFKLHEHGFVAPIFDREPDKHVDKDLTFSQRINQLVKLLSDWKSICDTIMKGDKLVMFVAGPVWSYSRCEANKQGNDKRRQLMEAGKTARAKVGKLTPREKAAEDRKSAAASSSPGIAATTTRATIDGPPRVEAQEYLGINAHPDFANTSDPYLDAAAAAVSSPAPMGTSNFRSSPIHVPSSPSPVVPSKPYTPRPAPTLYQMRRPVPLEPLPTPAPKLIPARGGAPPTGPQMGVFSSVVPRKRGASSPLEGEMGGKKGGK